MAITTNRDVAKHFQTTPDVDSALREESAKRKMSMSALIHQAVREYLQRQGHSASGYEYKVVPDGK